MTAMCSRSRARSAALTLSLTVFIAVTVLGLSLAASRASAVFAEITETGAPGYLVLSHDTATPLWSTLEPGQSSHWLIRASLNDAATGHLAIELRGTGELVRQGGLVGGVEACDGVFQLSTLTCNGDSTTAVAPVALRDLPQTNGIVQLADLHEAAPRDLLVTLRLPASTEIADGTTQTARIGLGVHASGDSIPSVTPITPTEQPPGLVVTGADALPLALIAAGLVGLGVTLAARRRTER